MCVVRRSLLFVGLCLLFVVCVVVCCSLVAFVVCCLAFWSQTFVVGCCLLLVVCSLLMVCGLSIGVFRLLFQVHCLVSRVVVVVCCLLCVVGCFARVVR